MKRYPCKSRLSITYKRGKDGRHYVSVGLRHHVKHVLYVDVTMPPEALQMIEEQAEWSTPTAMASKIQSAYPQVTTKQIHAAWRELSQAYWRRDVNQLLSAKKLLQEYGDEVDIFDLEGVPEGVEMLAWGMKHIAEKLRGKIIEVGTDATCESRLYLSRNVRK